MRDFFSKDEILPKRRAARIGPERILIIRDRDPLVRGERGVLRTSDLVQLAPVSRLCISVDRRVLSPLSFPRIFHLFNSLPILFLNSK